VTSNIRKDSISNLASPFLIFFSSPRARVALLRRARVYSRGMNLSRAKSSARGGAKSAPRVLKIGSSPSVGASRADRDLDNGNSRYQCHAVALRTREIVREWRL